MKEEIKQYERKNRQFFFFFCVCVCVCVCGEQSIRYLILAIVESSKFGLDFIIADYILKLRTSTCVLSRNALVAMVYIGLLFSCSPQEQVYRGLLTSPAGANYPLAACDNIYRNIHIQLYVDLNINISLALEGQSKLSRISVLNINLVLPCCRR